MWVYDEDAGLNCRDVTFVPGLYKIFDEILGKRLAFSLRWCFMSPGNILSVCAWCAFISPQ